MRHALQRLWPVLFICLTLGCEGGSTGSQTVSRCYPPGSCGDIATTSAVVAGDPVAGQQVWATNCARCHGEDGKGIQDARMIDMRKPSWHARFRDAAILRMVRAGRPPAMPAFDLPPGQLRDLLAYIRTLEKAPPSAPKPSY